MKITMNEATCRETFGDVYLLGVIPRYKYNEETRSYDESVIESVTANLACTHLDESITVNVQQAVLPNVKKMGKVKMVHCVYDPSATANSFEDRATGKQRSYGRVNDRFYVETLEPLTPADRLSDENGQPLGKEAPDKDSKK